MDRPRDHCIRCGECCKNSSPTLHIQDLSLIKNGHINRRHLFTIRRGELVRDNVNDQFRVSHREMIKVRTAPGEGGGCIFYDGKETACRIYRRRPVQCSALKCWDTTEFTKIFRSPGLERKDVVRDALLLGVIEEHERRCSYAKLEHQVQQIESEGEPAIERIIDALKFDFHLRPFISEKTGIDPEEIDFYLGRPLTETIIMFGLRIDREPDGSFFLTTVG